MRARSIRSSPMRALPIALLVAVLLGALLPAPASAQECPDRVRTSGLWKTIQGPTFTEGEQAIVDHGFDLGSAHTLLVTNGRVAMRSDDGGCSWREVFAVPESATPQYPYTAATARITIVEPLANGRYVLVVEESTPVASRPHIVVGGDGSWAPGDTGLPPVGKPDFVAGAPSAPNTVYLGIDVAGAVDPLLVSSDGGASWTPRSGPAGLSPGSNLTGLEVDPGNPANLWASAAAGFFRSTDGGQSFGAVTDFAGGPSGPADVHQAGRIMAYDQDDQIFRLSTDNGVAFLKRNPPSAQVTSMAHGPGPLDILISAGGKVWAYHAPSTQWIDVRAPVAGLTDLREGRGPSSVIVGRTARQLAVFGGGDLDPGDYTGDLDEILSGVPLLNPPEALAEGTEKLTPNRRLLKLDLRESATVDYELTLPGRKVPLEMFFLADTSDSQENTIRAMAESLGHIVNGFSDTGVAVEFGLGEFRSYPVFRKTPTPGPEPNFPYRKVLDLGASADEMRTALQNLQADGGGTFDSHLGALFQVATGHGQEVYPPGPANDVPPNEDPDWSVGTLKVVFVATDEPFGTETSGKSELPGDLDRPDIPSFDEVKDALNARDIYHVGISITEDPYLDLRQVSLDTGAVAPKGGLDCNGDGEAELHEGEPLVCQMTQRNLDDGQNLVPAIVNLVNSIRSRSDVSLEVGTDSPVVDKVTPPSQQIIDQLKTTLTFSVTYKCTPAEAGKTFDVDLEAIKDGSTVGTSLARVKCTEKPKFDAAPAVVAFIAPIPFILAAIIPPAPPPPPGATTANPQFQAQFHAQAAAARQEEQQPQLAMVHSFHQAAAELAEEEEGLKMSAVRHQEPAVPPAFTFAAGAVMASLAAAFVLTRRTSYRLATVRRR